MTEAQVYERIARMETELQYLKRDMAEVKGDVSDIKEKQDQMITLLTEANGMRKMLRWVYASAIIVGGFILTYWTAIKGFLTKVGG